MSYVLDTNICIYALKKRPLEVLERLRMEGPGRVAISSVTAAELRYGASKSSMPEKNHAVLDIFLSRIDVLSFDSQATRTYGDIRATLERQGTPIGPLDLLIAAHTASLNRTLVTNNTREFHRVPGLKIENWAQREVEDDPR